MTRVSVAVAVRDVAPYLDEALDSVLDQLGPDDEVVVVDDGSTDATPDLLAARGPAITVVSPGAVGLGNARNLAFDHGTGRYVGFVDGDDRWAPGSLDALLAALEAHPEADLALGRTDEFLDPSITDAAAVGLRQPQRGVSAFLLGATLMRRELTDAVRFDPDQPTASTADWLAKARSRGVVIQEVDQIVLHRRLRTDSLTTDAAAYRAAMLRSMRTSLHRARPG